jgi:glycosyltransferase involved in cell wall biosynthesis
MDEAMKFSIILPVYNQQPFIQIIVGDYLKILEGQPWDYEILLVVNGCHDGSLEACQELARQHAVVKVFHTPEKGWGRAVRLGIQQATGELICFTNSSRTQPQDLLKFLQCSFQTPNYIVKATRKIRENWLRRLGSILYNIQCRIFFDLNSWDINGTPKIFPRRFERLLTLTRDDDLLDLEFLLQAKNNAYPMIEIPVFFYKRVGGRSTTGYGTALRLYKGAFELWSTGRKVNHTCST